MKARTESAPSSRGRGMNPETAACILAVLLALALFPQGKPIRDDWLRITPCPEAGDTTWTQLFSPSLVAPAVAILQERGWSHIEPQGYSDAQWTAAGLPAPLQRVSARCQP
ncbi:MAG: hypothetical protein QOG31_1084 [Thermoplasmata archaeon]|jgi:hypothetical protein|nr:hypothetical protein [Thermoplasmata archaeon]